MSHCQTNEASGAVRGRPLTDTEALALHIAQENWDTPEQLRVISELRVRDERLPEELRTAIRPSSD